MFKINPSPTFRARVPLTIPGEETRAVVDFTFRHKGRVAFAAWWESIDGRKDVEILADIIVGWSGVLDDKGDEIAFSSEALTQVLDHYPASAMEIHAAYRKALWESREKN